jgi:hypothetical protein
MAATLSRFADIANGVGRFFLGVGAGKSAMT